MPYPEDSYSEPDEPGGGYRDEPDPAICPGCGADLRAVGIVEHEPVWMEYRWYLDAEGHWEPDMAFDPENEGRVESMDSDWQCGACGAKCIAPDALEEELRDAL